eukprot:503269-Rhodomonas_salina.4
MQIHNRTLLSSAKKLQGARSSGRIRTEEEGDSTSLWMLFQSPPSTFDLEPPPSPPAAPITPPSSAVLRGGREAGRGAEESVTVERGGREALVLMGFLGGGCVSRSRSTRASTFISSRGSCGIERARGVGAVSYTHLTLPTICSV